MKKLLVLVAACGGSTHNTVPVTDPTAVAAPTPSKPSPPPTDLENRMHAFVMLPSQLHWEGNLAAISDDIKFEKVQAGASFDVTYGPAVVVRGDVRNEKNQQVVAWNHKAHRLICSKGTECLIAGHSNVQADPAEKYTTDLQWQPLDPSRPDPVVVQLWGDGTKGPNGFLMKMKAGGAPFWHVHRNNYWGVVLTGTVVSYESGTQPEDMPAGTLWWQPRGNKHTTDCKGPEDCVVYLDFAGAFDVKAVP